MMHVVKGRSWLSRILMLAVMSVAMTFMGISAAAQDGTPITAPEATPVTETSPCEALGPGVGSEAWVQTELYFGTTGPDGEKIADEDWDTFLDEEVTSRFPAGLTVLEGYGQFQNSTGAIGSEDSIVLILLYPPDDGASSALIEEIRDAYETQFEQESVLRVDTAPVCVSF